MLKTALLLSSGIAALAAATPAAAAAPRCVKHMCVRARGVLAAARPARAQTTCTPRTAGRRRPMLRCERHRRPRSIGAWRQRAVLRSLLAWCLTLCALLSATRAANRATALRSCLRLQLMAYAQRACVRLPAPACACLCLPAHRICRRTAFASLSSPLPLRMGRRAATCSARSRSPAPCVCRRHCGPRAGHLARGTAKRIPARSAEPV